MCRYVNGNVLDKWYYSKIKSDVCKYNSQQTEPHLYTYVVKNIEYLIFEMLYRIL